MNDDKEIISKAVKLLSERYKQYQHHVACVLRTDKNDYCALHLDSEGFDVCAESIAISNALFNDDNNIMLAVAVTKNKLGQIVITNPCGNCRQLLLQYAPEAEVIVIDSRGGHKRVSVTDLIPFPYVKS